MKEQCESCKFWKLTYGMDVDKGLCRTISPSRDSNGDGVWPLTLPTDWCGSYEEVYDREDH